MVETGVGLLCERERKKGKDDQEDKKGGWEWVVKRENRNRKEGRHQK